MTRKLGRRTALVGAAACLVSAPAARGAADEASVVMLAVGSELPPLLVRDPATGALTGMAVDAILAATRPLGWAVRFQIVPWARAQRMVETGDADVLCTRATDERRRYALFSRDPLFTLHSAVLHFRADNPRAPALRAAASLDDLRPFTIALALGDSWPAPLFAGWPNIRTVRTSGMDFNLVVAGHADVTIHAREMAKFAYQRLGVPPLEARDADFLPGGVSEYRFGLRRSFPDAEALMRRFDERRAAEPGEVETALAAYR